MYHTIKEDNLDFLVINVFCQIESLLLIVFQSSSLLKIQHVVKGGVSFIVFYFLFL